MWEIKEVNTSEVYECPLCGMPMDECGYCDDCEVVVDTEHNCPECNSVTWRHDDPGINYGQVYCLSKDCKYTENDVLSWEDIKAFNNR
jgi:hypothetical protein